MLDNFANVIFMDLGGNKVTVYDSNSKNFTKMSSDDFISYSLGRESGVLMIGESSHFGTPQSEDIKKRSLSQYWKEYELLDWYQGLEDRGITLKLFPHKETEKWRRAFDLDKSDESDCLAMQHALTCRPELFVSLQNPKYTFVDPLRDEGIAMKDEITDDKNFMRHTYYQHEDDMITKFVKDNLQEIADGLDDETRKIFLIEGKVCRKDGVPYQKSLKKIIQLSAIAALLKKLDGENRTRPSTGELPGWDFTRNNLIRLHAMHQRGGVARSDLTWWGRGSWVSKQMGHSRRSSKNMAAYNDEQRAQFRKFRNEYDRHVKKVWKSMKNIIEKA